MSKVFSLDEFLSAAGAATVTGKKGASATVHAQVYCSINPGSIGITPAAMQLINLVPGNRVVVKDLSTLGMNGFAIYKGITNKTDALEARYQNENPMPSGDLATRRDRRAAYEAQRTAWVQEQLGDEKDHAVVGNILSDAKSPAFSSSAAWYHLGGNKEGRVTYKATKAHGFVLVDGVPSVVTSLAVVFPVGAQFLVIQPTIGGSDVRLATFDELSDSSTDFLYVTDPVTSTNDDDDDDNSTATATNSEVPAAKGFTLPGLDDEDGAFNI
jgi:hypothetical protein